MSNSKTVGIIHNLLLWQGVIDITNSMKIKPQKKHFLFFHKAIAIFLSGVLFLSNLQGYAAPDISPVHDGGPTRAEGVSIPEEFGKIEESFDGKTGKKVIYIQDAHDSLQAQEKIAKMIHTLVEHENVKTVLEEGYEGRVPTDKYFKRIQDPKIREKVAYFLMDKLRLGGAEYAHITRAKDFELIGADSLKLHKKNIERYQESHRHRKQIEKDLAVMGAAVEKLAQKYFPGDVKEWMKIKECLDRQEIGLLDYLRRSRKLFLRSLGPERFSMRYPNASLLLSAGQTHNEKAILELKTTFRSKEFFQEINRMEDDYAKAHFKEARNFEIFREYKLIQLLKRLSSIEVAEEEYEAVKEQLKEINTAKIATFIARQSRKSVVLSKGWEKHIQNAIGFYGLAKARDASIESRLEEYHKSKSQEPVVLVYGGFHKESIKRILKKNKLSYKIITPAITSISTRHQQYYKQLMQIGYSSINLPTLVAKATRPPNIFAVVAEMGGKSEMLFMEQIDWLTDEAGLGRSVDEIDLDLKALYQRAELRREANAKRSSPIWGSRTANQLEGRKPMLSAQVTSSKLEVSKTAGRSELRADTEKVVIDASVGEGGGQVIRTSAVLSAILGTPVELQNIRANRSQPGLRTVHTANLELLASISGAVLKGNDRGSRTLEMMPGNITSGRHSVDIDALGSADNIVGTVFQSLIPILSFAPDESEVTITGGTHISGQIPLNHVQEVLLPLLQPMGIDAHIDIHRYGWWGKGGEAVIRVRPVQGPLRPLILSERGKIQKIQAVIYSADFEPKDLESLKGQILMRLSKQFLPDIIEIQIRNVSTLSGNGPAIFISLKPIYKKTVAGGFELLAKNPSEAEQKLNDLFKTFEDFNSSGAAVDEHVADMLVLFMALAAGKSEITVPVMTEHLTTNLQTIQSFLPVKFHTSQIDKNGQRVFRIEVEGIGKQNSSSFSEEREFLELLSIEKIRKEAAPLKYILDIVRQYRQTPHSAENHRQFSQLVSNAFAEFPPEPRILSVVGISASGKSTVVNRLLKEHPDKFMRLTRTTTRGLRPEDLHLKNHRFLSIEEFLQGVKDQTIYSPRFNAGHHYGYSLEDILDVLLQDKIILMEALNSAKALQKIWPAAQVRIAGVLPLRYQGETDEEYEKKASDILRNRMRKRDSAILETEIEKRLHESGNITQIRKESHFILLNPDGVSIDTFYKQFEAFALRGYDWNGVGKLAREVDRLIDFIRLKRAELGQPLLDAGEEKNIRETAYWVIEAHKHQMREDRVTPQFVHTLDVTRTIVDKFNITDPLSIQISLLHDTREDQEAFYGNFKLILERDVEGSLRNNKDINLIRLGVRMLSKISLEKGGDKEFYRRLVAPRSIYNKNERPENAVSTRYDEYSDEFIHRVQLIKLAARIKITEDLKSLFKTGLNLPDMQTRPSRSFAKILDSFIPEFVLNPKSLLTVEERNLFLESFLKTLREYSRMTDESDRPLRDAAIQAEARLKQIIGNFRRSELRREANAGRSSPIWGSPTANQFKGRKPMLLAQGTSSKLRVSKTVRRSELRTRNVEKAKLIDEILPVADGTREEIAEKIERFSKATFGRTEYSLSVLEYMVELGFFDDRGIQKLEKVTQILEALKDQNVIGLIRWMFSEGFFQEEFLEKLDELVRISNVMQTNLFRIETGSFEMGGQQATHRRLEIPAGVEAFGVLRGLIESHFFDMDAILKLKKLADNFKNLREASGDRELEVVEEISHSIFDGAAKDIRTSEQLDRLFEKSLRTILKKENAIHRLFRAGASSLLFGVLIAIAAYFFAIPQILFLFVIPVAIDVFRFILSKQRKPEASRYDIVFPERIEDFMGGLHYPKLDVTLQKNMSKESIANYYLHRARALRASDEALLKHHFTEDIRSRIKERLKEYAEEKELILEAVADDEDLSEHFETVESELKILLERLDSSARSEIRMVPKAFDKPQSARQTNQKRTAKADKAVIFVDASANDQQVEELVKELAVLAASNSKRMIVVYNTNRALGENKNQVEELLKSFELPNIKFVSMALSEVLKPYQFRPHVDLIYYSASKEEAVFAGASTASWLNHRLTRFVGEAGALGYGLKHLEAVKLNKSVEDITFENGYYAIAPRASEMMRLLQEAKFVTVLASSA